MKKTHDKDFELKICNNILKEIVTVGQIAKECNISRPIISRWIAEFHHYGNKAFNGNSIRKSDKINLYVLKQQIKELQIKNKILKKFEHFVK
ncbi:MAG: transposase [Fusobacteriaceae bacterium]